MNKDNSPRTKALGPKDSELSLEDTIRGSTRMGRRPKAALNGHDPYDRDSKERSRKMPARPTDLRKLSEWIRMKREIEALNNEEARTDSTK